MARFIEDNGLELCIIDPAYMCFDGADAGNVFIMGGMLRSIAEVFVAHKATMLLLHHSTKPAGLDGQPIELTDLSFAGFREFAAQWLLLSRRRRYIPGSGHHELWLSVGGRAGHSGLWGLDVDEGEFQVGGERKWEVRVLPHGDVHREEESQRESAKAETRAARATARIDADKRCIIKALAKIPSGDVVPVEVSKPNRKTPYQAYKLAESTNP
jgi:hypothetical protein